MTAPAAAPRGRKAHDVETDAARLRRYGAERRPEDREWLVKRYLPLAKHVAARYSGGSEPLDDLHQVASLGLVKAIDRFDVSRGVSFSSYAVPTIAGELRRYFRDHTWSLRVPRDVQELAVKIGKVESALQLDLGRAPTAAELADSPGLQRRAAARGARRRRREPHELARPPVSSDDEEGASLADMLGEADDGASSTSSATMTVDAALARLGSASG